MRHTDAPHPEPRTGLHHRRVVDAHRPGGDDFGEERVNLFLAQSVHGLDAMETVRQLTHQVLDHHGYLSDDATVFLVERR